MSTNCAWVFLLIAGLLEICWVAGLKYTEGFTKFIPSIFTLITLIGSMYLLAKASQTLPIGIAYSVWVGIAALGAAVLGVVLFNESVTPLRLFFFGLLFASITGLKLTS